MKIYLVTVLPVPPCYNGSTLLTTVVLTFYFYCSAPFCRSSFIKLVWVLTDTKEFAAIVPEAATPGNPIPVSFRGYRINNVNALLIHMRIQWYNHIIKIKLQRMTYLGK